MVVLTSGRLAAPGPLSDRSVARYPVPMAFRLRAPSLLSSLSVLAAAAWMAGCSCDEPAGRCTTSSDCGAGASCIDERCVFPSDAGGHDGAIDAPRLPVDANDTDACAIPCAGRCCGAGERCTSSNQCALDLGPCTGDGDCLDDSYCLDGRCTPYGTLPRGSSNDLCRRAVVPGRFSPALQCEWSAPPNGDPAPTSREVETTPLVVDFGIDRGPDDPSRPSIVFITAVTPNQYGAGGIVRIIDGRTCADQAVFADPADAVGAATTPVLGDLDGDGRAEIVAKSAEGGLVAFGWDETTSSFQRRWYSHDRSGARDRTGGAGTIPSLSMADLDDDGSPEVIMGGVVYAADGTLLDAAIGLRIVVGYGAPAVIADLDDDGPVELALGDAVYDWDRTTHAWTLRPWTTARVAGFVAVADLGEFPSVPGNVTGGPEIAVIADGTARVQTRTGDLVFGPIDLPGGAHGGNPTIADFDGDGRAEFASGGPGTLSVFDLDCVATPDGAGTCGTSRTDGVLWSAPVRDFSSGINGSSVFDFEGDGRAEVVYADECYVRVFDGRTGQALWSAPRTSGTWIEAPVVADVDGDFNAEIVVGSNGGGMACAPFDELHAGLACMEDRDCPTRSGCVEGLCRCSADTDCGDVDSYHCTSPLATSAGTGNVCRAYYTGPIRGIRVFQDASDRWVSSRRIWNQHAYAVTNVGDEGAIPRTSMAERNWTVAGLNNFRMNVQGQRVPLAGPDLTIGRGSFDRGCSEAMPVIPLRGEVCNRGSEAVDTGMVATFFDGDPREGGTAICSAETTRVLAPGVCENVGCDWDPAPTTGTRSVWLFVDAADDNVECIETNNIARIASVGCTVE